jgi:hypothetical protein
MHTKAIMLFVLLCELCVHSLVHIVTLLFKSKYPAYTYTQEVS